MKESRLSLSVTCFDIYYHWSAVLIFQISCFKVITPPKLRILLGLLSLLSVEMLAGWLWSHNLGLFFVLLLLLLLLLLSLLLFIFDIFGWIFKESCHLASCAATVVQIANKTWKREIVGSIFDAWIFFYYRDVITIAKLKAWAPCA